MENNIDNRLKEHYNKINSNKNQTDLILKGVRELEDKVQFMYIKLYIVGIICLFLIVSLAFGSIPSNYNCNKKSYNLNSSSNSTFYSLNKIVFK